MYRSARLCANAVVSRHREGAAIRRESRELCEKDTLHGRHDPALLEDLGQNSYLGFSGTAATVTDGISTITTLFDGWIEYVQLQYAIGPWYQFPPAAVITKRTCDSATHRLTLIREN